LWVSLGAYPRGGHTLALNETGTNAPTYFASSSMILRVGSAIIRKHFINMEILASDKHLSLYGPYTSDEWNQVL
jgi:hypothetical protein